MGLDLSITDTPRSLRWRCGLTQAALSQRSGVPVRVIARWEAGDIRRVERAKEIGKALGVTAGQVVDVADQWAAAKRAATLGAWARKRSNKK